MKRDVKPDGWAAHNVEMDARLAALMGMRSVPYDAVEVRRFVKYGRTRWEAVPGYIYARKFRPIGYFCFATKDEAVAKAVELRLKDYVREIRL